VGKPTFFFLSKKNQQKNVYYLFLRRFYTNMWKRGIFYYQVLQDFRFTSMGAVRRTNEGWRQAVKPFGSVGWHHDSKWSR
jgi:hypothetical protein